MKKIILDLCGGTGAWSAPYRDAADEYDVRVITLPKYDLFDTKMRDGNIILKNRETDTEEIVRASEVYGIFAAPTCTMFSLARTRAKTPRDFKGGMELVQKCLEIIWYCRESEGSCLKFWALENPMGYLRQFLGKPPLTFSPEEYGENYTKKTDIWGFYNLPPKAPYSPDEEERKLCRVNSRKLPKLPEGYIMPEGWSRQAARRSITSGKFAQAFFKANR